MKSVCIMQSHVDAHFAGAIAPEDERAMRAHVATCDTCRARYRKQLVLAKLDPEALSASVRLGQGLGLKKSPNVVRFGWPAAGMILAAAAGVLLFLHAPSAGDGFVARGAIDESAAAVLAAPLHVYRVAPHEGAIPVFDTVHRDDELAFAYENGDRKKYVMIFAVNEQGRVYWFYPGWSARADNPLAIAISAESGLHELPDAVVHRFDGLQLEVHSLFLDTPMTVRDVERDLEKRPSAGPLSLPGAVDHVARFRVVP